MSIMTNFNIEIEDTPLGDLYPTKKVMNDDMMNIANRGYAQPKSQYTFSSEHINRFGFEDHEEIGFFPEKTTKVYNTIFRKMYETNNIRHNFLMLLYPQSTTESIYPLVHMWSLPLNPQDNPEYNETKIPVGRAQMYDYKYVKSFIYNQVVYKPFITYAKIVDGKINENYIEGSASQFRTLAGLKTIVDENREDIYIASVSMECALWNKNTNTWNYNRQLMPILYGFNEVNCLQSYMGMFAPFSQSIRSSTAKQEGGLVSDIDNKLKTYYYDYNEGTTRRIYDSNLCMLSAMPEFTFTPFDIENPELTKAQITITDNDSVWVTSISNIGTDFVTYKHTRYFKPTFVYKKLAELGVYMTSYQGATSGYYEEFCADRKPNELKNYSDVFLGEMLENGITTGNFLVGEEIDRSTTPNKSGSTEDVNYKPSFDVSAEDIIATQYRGISVHSSYFLKYYLMTQQNMINFSNEIKLAYGDEIFNVQDYIVSILEIPRLYLSNAVISTTENIKIANWTYQTAEGGLLSYNFEDIFLGELLVERHHFNFLDYEPYTTLMLYVPFCGMVTLPADFVMGYTILLWGHCDFETGHLIVEIYCRGGLVTSIEGNCARVVTFSSSSSIQKIMGVVGSVAQLGVDIINTVKNPFMLSALPVDVNNITESIGANYITLSKGKGTSSSFAMTNKPCLYRYTTVKTNQDGFAKSVGNRCERFSRLNEFSGLTVCKNPIINVTATDVERTEIYELLQRGVIL